MYTSLREIFRPEAVASWRDALAPFARSANADLSPAALDADTHEDTFEPEPDQSDALIALVKRANDAKQTAALLLAAESWQGRMPTELLHAFFHGEDTKAWMFLERGLAAAGSALSRPPAWWWTRFEEVCRFYDHAGGKSFELDLCVARAMASAGRLDEAIERVSGRCERVANDFGHHSEATALCTLHLAVLLHRRGDDAGVKAAFAEVDDVASELSDSAAWLVRAYEAMVATRIGRIGKALAIIEALARDARHEPQNVPPPVPPLPLAPAIPNDEVSFTLDLFWDSFGLSAIQYQLWMNLTLLREVLTRAGRSEESAQVEASLAALIRGDVATRGAYALDQVREAIAALRRVGKPDAARFLEQLHALNHA